MKKNRNSLFSDLGDLLFDPVENPDGPSTWATEDRLALITALMEDDIVQQVFEGAPRMYRVMIQAGWIDEAELLQNAKSLSAAMPRAGLAMIEMAEICCLRDELVEAEAWLESARQWLEKNSDGDDAESQRPERWRLHLVEAGLAVRGGKLQEAAEILPRLSPVVLEPGLDSNHIKNLQNRQELLGLRRLLELAGWKAKETVSDDPVR